MWFKMWGTLKLDANDKVEKMETQIICPIYPQYELAVNIEKTHFKEYIEEGVTTVDNIYNTTIHINLPVS